MGTTNPIEYNWIEQFFLFFGKQDLEAQWRWQRLTTAAAAEAAVTAAMRISFKLRWEPIKIDVCENGSDYLQFN